MTCYSKNASLFYSIFSEGETYKKSDEIMASVFWRYWHVQFNCTGLETVLTLVVTIEKDTHI